MSGSRKTLGETVSQAGLKAFIVITVWLALLGIVGLAVIGYIDTTPGTFTAQVVSQAWGFIIFIAGIAIAKWLFGQEETP